MTRTGRVHVILVAAMLIGFAPVAAAQQKIATAALIDGTTFSYMDTGRGPPRLTVFVFAAERYRTLREEQFMKFGHIMSRSMDCLFVSLDAPGHGDDRRENEPDEGLSVWRVRIDRNENFVVPFIQRATAVLDHLVANGRADPDRIAVAGTSRGGYLALHFAAAEPRIKAVALFSSVTELTVLREFEGLETHPLTRSLAVTTLSDKLAARPVWHCIGNHDERVGTDEAITFSRLLVSTAVSLQKPAPVEIHVMESAGHRTPLGAWSLAAAWLMELLDRK